MTTTRKKTPPPAAFILVSSILALSLAVLGCASKGPQPEENIGEIDTRSIFFECAEEINQGLLLPVDVVYVTRYRMPREITAVGPDRWFDSIERRNWPERQTLSLSGGDAVTLQLKRLWLENTKLIFILANFKDVNDPAPQLLVIDQTARKNEKIRVMSDALIFER
jgi:hypothetical protein